MSSKNIKAKELRERVENKKTVLVDFWAPWCPHCRRINAAYEQISEQYADILEVVKVDMDEDDALWDEWEVELIPTLRIYRDGEALGSVVAPGSKAAIESFLSKVLLPK